MKNFSKIALCAMIVTAGAFTSCSKDDAPDTTPDPTSIYARLGGNVKQNDPDNPGQQIEKGRLAFRTVVNTAIGKIVADATDANSGDGDLRAHFAPILAETTTQGTSVAKLSKNLTDFFCVNTGGQKTNTYTGIASMVNAHNPASNVRMGVKSTGADYTKFEIYVGESANEAGVASGTQLYTDIVAVLESLRPQIVQAP